MVLALAAARGADGGPEARRLLLRLPLRVRRGGERGPPRAATTPRARPPVAGHRHPLLPISYGDRGVPGTSPSMTSAESVIGGGQAVARRGRHPHVPERDDRLRRPPRPRPDPLAMRRNTAQAAIRGFGTWWMDLPAEGGFADPRIWEEMRLLRPVDEALLARARPFAPEIAAVVDEDSMCHLAEARAPRGVRSSTRAARRSAASARPTASTCSPMSSPAGWARRSRSSSPPGRSPPRAAPPSAPGAGRTRSASGSGPPATSVRTGPTRRAWRRSPASGAGA